MNMIVGPNNDTDCLPSPVAEQPRIEHSESLDLVLPSVRCFKCDNLVHLARECRREGSNKQSNGDPRTEKDIQQKQRATRKDKNDLLQNNFPTQNEMGLQIIGK